MDLIENVQRCDIYSIMLLAFMVVTAVSLDVIHIVIPNLCF
jgi:hypothetical protein